MIAKTGGKTAAQESRCRKAYADNVFDKLPRPPFRVTSMRGEAPQDVTFMSGVVGYAAKFTDVTRLSCGHLEIGARPAVVQNCAWPREAVCKDG